MYISDTHAHLFLEEFDPDREAVIKRARAAGVGYILNAAIDLPSSRKVIELAKTCPALPAAIGIHPHNASRAIGDYVSELSLMADNENVVAVGEIGLDFHWGNGDRDIQVKVFREQLNLAGEKSLPVIIHCRDAEDLMLEILTGYAAKHPVETGTIRGVRHCFNLGLEEAHRYLGLGLMLSFGGYITYPSSHLEDVIRAIPQDRLLLETDSPYLPPQAYRGKRNEPAYIVHVAQALACILDIPVSRAARLTSTNALVLFGLPPVTGLGAEG